MANVPGRRRRRPLLSLFLVMVLLGAGSVVIQRWVAPPATFLMISRAVEGEGLSYRWRSLDDISPRLVQAVIASEDATFCAHSGFDMKAIERALQANARAEKRGTGRIRGGSTISQQTAKNVFLWPGRDWIRKGLEAGYTVAIETLWGKRRIMEVYLNSIEWGPGVYGAEAAARKNFKVPARSLTVAQSARLAAILPSPLKWKAAKPGPYVQKRSGRITRNARAVRREGLTACVL